MRSTITKQLATLFRRAADRLDPPRVFPEESFMVINNTLKQWPNGFGAEANRIVKWPK